MGLLMFCLLFFENTILAQADLNSHLCDVTIPISSPLASIRIAQNRASIKTGLEFATGGLQLQNETDSAILEYVLLLEVFDASNRRIYGLTFHESSYDQPVSPFDFLPVSRLKRAIAPGAKVIVFGYSPMVSTRCPTSGALRVVFLKFANGTTSVHTSPGWRTDPGVAVPTDHLNLKNCGVPNKTGAVATITVDSNGQLNSFDFHGASLPPACSGS